MALRRPSHTSQLVGSCETFGRYVILIHPRSPRRPRCCTRIRPFRSPQDPPTIARPLQQPLLQLGVQLPLHHGCCPHHCENRRLQRPIPWLQGDAMARPAFLSTTIRLLRGRAGMGKEVHGLEQHRTDVGDCYGSNGRRHGRRHNDTP